MLIQTLSAKLGIATGRNLPEVCRDQLLAPTSRSPLGPGRGDRDGDRPRRVPRRRDRLPPADRACRSSRPRSSPASPRSSILGLQRFGFRPLEAVIATLVGVIGVCYVAELGVRAPRLRRRCSHHAVMPQFGGNEALLLAVGILGATVMPHVIYLHSALTQDRIVAGDRRGRADAAALHAHRRDRRDVDRRPDQPRDARDGRDDVLRQRAPPRRLARGRRTRRSSRSSAARRARSSRSRCSRSGLSSSAVGTLSGQVVMQGFIRRQIPITVRRLVTMVPAFVVIAIGRQPVADARPLPGRALVRDPVRARPARLLHGAQRTSWASSSTGSDHDGRVASRP